MAIEPTPKKKKRIKVKVKPGQEAPTIPAGFERDPSRSKPGKDDYVRKTEKSETKLADDQSQFREPTAEEKKSMQAGTFYGPNQAQYREPVTSVTKEKEEMVVKKKEPKYKETGPSTTAQERRESRQASREMRKTERQFKQGCPIGRGRIGRARY